MDLGRTAPVGSADARMRLTASSTWPVSGGTGEQPFSDALAVASAYGLRACLASRSTRAVIRGS